MTLVDGRHRVFTGRHRELEEMRGKLLFAASVPDSGRIVTHDLSTEGVMIRAKDIGEVGPIIPGGDESWLR